MADHERREEDVDALHDCAWDHLTLCVVSVEVETLENPQQDLLQEFGLLGSWDANLLEECSADFQCDLLHSYCWLKQVDYDALDVSLLLVRILRELADHGHQVGAHCWN